VLGHAPRAGDVDHAWPILFGIEQTREVVLRIILAWCCG
jgi:hypothetical protein